MSPFSIVHCPAWRGDIRAQVGTKLGYADPQAAVATAKNLLSFNATRTCADIACFYNSMNRYIDHVIASDIPVAEIEPSAARDTFL